MKIIVPGLALALLIGGAVGLASARKRQPNFKRRCLLTR
jgi:hypothetical protein